MSPKIGAYFIQLQIIIQHSDYLIKLKFSDPSTHLADDEIYIGDSTTALLVHLNENEAKVMNVYKGAIPFYLRFVQKQLQTFDSKFNLLHILSFLNPPNSQNIKQNIFDKTEKILPLTFNKVALKLEHGEFAVDGTVTFSEIDAVTFWVNVYNTK